MDDDDLVPLSALQHYLYCPRQCALIHLERMWAENRQTAEGRIMHEVADQVHIGKRHGVRTACAMPLLSHDLGLVGVADVVEFCEGEQPYVLPVEYKRGRPKAHRADEVQLCAQGLCLETMLGVHIDEGALFYGQTRRRLSVKFDLELRRLTIETVAATRAMLLAGKTPPPQYQARRCDGCSLIDLCQPRILSRNKSVATWLDEQMKGP